MSIISLLILVNKNYSMVSVYSVPMQIEKKDAAVSLHGWVDGE